MNRFNSLKNLKFWAAPSKYTSLKTGNVVNTYCYRFINLIIDKTEAGEKLTSAWLTEKAIKEILASINTDKY
jgi:hypothetical protein